MIRRAVFLLLGMLIGGFSVMAFAASVSPTVFNTMGKTSGSCNWTQDAIAGTGATAQASCEASKSVAQTATGSCYVPGVISAATASASGTSCFYTCRNTQGQSCSWSTAIVPVCPEGSTYNTTTQMCDGAVAKDCPAYGTATSSGYYLQSAVSSSGSACTPSKCTVQFQGDCPAGKDAAGNLYCKGEYVSMGGKEGECTSTASAASPSSTTPETTEPPCKEGESVVTSSTGKVACVPSGTDNSETPKTGEKTTTETKADGSSVTTNTTTTCTGDGACSSTTTTTITGAGGGTTPGLAGDPGTTTKTTETKGSGTTDESCDPTKQMCTEPSTSSLYTKKGKEMKGPISTFAEGLKASALSSSSSEFFTVTVPTGSCPAWSASIDYLNVTVDISEYFCNAAAESVMGIIGTVLMVVAAFSAFRWAIL